MVGTYVRAMDCGAWLSITAGVEAPRLVLFARAFNDAISKISADEPLFLSAADKAAADLGRSSRLFSRAKRKAMALRDRHCRAEGRTVPATWCAAHHHRTPWSHGGRTDLADGLLLCRWHHHRAHDDRYRHPRLPDGDLRYIRRT